MRGTSNFSCLHNPKLTQASNRCLFLALGIFGKIFLREVAVQVCSCPHFPALSAFSIPTWYDLGKEWGIVTVPLLPFPGDLSSEAKLCLLLRLFSYSHPAVGWLGEWLPGRSRKRAWGESLWACSPVPTATCHCPCHSAEWYGSNLNASASAPHVRLQAVSP